MIIILLLTLLSVFKIGTHKGTYCAELLRRLRKSGTSPFDRGIKIVKADRTGRKSSAHVAT